MSKKINADMAEKIGNLLNGDRTEAEQLDLIFTGLIVFIDVLRSLRGNPAAIDFLKLSIRAIADGKRPRFSLVGSDREEVA